MKGGGGEGGLRSGVGRKEQCWRTDKLRTTLISDAQNFLCYGILPLPAWGHLQLPGGGGGGGRAGRRKQKERKGRKIKRVEIGVKESKRGRKIAEKTAIRRQMKGGNTRGLFVLFLVEKKTISSSLPRLFFLFPLLCFYFFSSSLVPSLVVILVFHVFSRPLLLSFPNLYSFSFSFS